MGCPSWLPSLPPSIFHIKCLYANIHLSVTLKHTDHSNLINLTSYLFNIKTLNPVSIYSISAVFDANLCFEEAEFYSMLFLPLGYVYHWLSRRRMHMPFMYSRLDYCNYL